MSNKHIDHNLEKIRKRIELTCERVGRNPDEIMLVAVSKTKPDADILEAITSGQLSFGENRMKELEEKMLSIQNPEIDWHMIGNLQTNKIRFIANRVNWIHSVEKSKYLKEIDKRAKEYDRVINVLIQVNISGETQKGGCEPNQLKSVLESVKGMNNIMIKGLMGMATFVNDPEQVRSEFQLLKQLLDENQNLNNNNIELEHLSMGMSNDMEVAIEEGSTMVRIGSDIFGARNYP